MSSQNSQNRKREKGGSKKFKMYAARECYCPTCGHLFTKATSVTGSRRPRLGDVMLCFYCGEILLFDVGRWARIPTAAEMIEIQTAEDWPTVERLARAVRVQKPAGDVDGTGRVCIICSQRPCRCPVYASES